MKHVPHDCNDDDCWLTDFKSPGPYGHVSIRRDDGQLMCAHRLAWEAHNAEPIPEGMVVMHTCDNGGCINPNHLTLGTQRDNLIDMVKKQRHRWRNYIPIYPSRGTL